MHPLTQINSFNTDVLVYQPLESLTAETPDTFESNTIYTVFYRHNMQSLAAFIKLHSLTRGTNAIDATVVDRIGHELRFNVVYHLQSTSTNTRYVLSTWASETRPVMSLQSLFPAFNWTEREIWDMFGLFILNHPDLRRILTDYGFVGHPLRKDFPLTGFKETQYEDTIKHVEYVNAELAQSYRLLSFANPWPHDQKNQENL